MSERCYSNLVDLLEQKAQEKPDFPVYTFLQGSPNGNQSLCYAELAEQAKTIAVALQKKTRPGDRVLIIYPPGLELISAFFGCLYAGVIVIPVYPPSSKDMVAKLQHIIKNSQASVVLTTEAFVQQFKKLRLAKLLSRNALVHKVSQKLIGPSFKRRLPLTEWDFERMHFIATDTLAFRADEWSCPSLNQDSLAFLQYTSGSTGQPKGVMVSHANLLHNLEAIEQRYQTSEEDVGVSWLPPYHDMGLIGGILQPLYSSFAAKLMSPFTFLQRPALWLKAVSHFQATITVAPNFAYDLCLTKVSEAERSELDLSRLEIAATGAEPIRSATIERFAEHFASCGFQAKAFYPCYGLAESTLLVTSIKRQEGIQTQLLDSHRLSQGRVSYCEVDHPNVRKLISCGRPAEGFHVSIVNPETLQECARDEVGEIWIRSQSVTQGYWQLPEESLHSFQASLAKDERKFLRTGDCGYLDGGNLYVTGRLKEMIIIRGRNYYPHDLEHTIHGCHPELRANCCATFSVEEGDRELLIVVQEVKGNTSPALAEEIIRQIRSKILKTHGIAVDVVMLAGRRSVPKTTSGKIQRLLCRQNYLAKTIPVLYLDDSSKANEELHQRSSEETTDELSRLLQPIFAKPLAQLDLDKKLSELGLTSLKLGELQYLMSTLSKRDVPLEYLFMDPSLKEILSLLKAKADLSLVTQHHQVDLDLEFDKHRLSAISALHFSEPVPQQILLTGATGFLGAYLLSEFLLNTSWQVACLVQAGALEEGLERIAKNLEGYGLWKTVYRERIKVVLGNLEQGHLGLNEQNWANLAEEIDLIVHSAAALNFIYPYQKLKAANVLGTRQLLELAATNRPKALHYISTIGYFMSADLADNRVIREQNELSSAEGIYGGYNQTKWLAEKLVSDARKHKLPMAIYRPSLITGESDRGYWNEADVVCRILKGCVQLGARPLMPGVKLNFVPVDYVAKAVVSLAKEGPYKSDTFHLLNPKDVDLELLFARCQARGFPMAALDYANWKEKIKKACRQQEGSAFAPLLAFFTEKVYDKNASLFDLYLHNNRATIDCTYSQERLARQALYCPQIEETLFDKYLDCLIESGYLIH